MTIIDEMRFIASLLLVLLIASPAMASPPPDEAAHPLGIFDNLLPRKHINTSITGVNAFANDQRFGTVRQQYSEVKRKLRLKYVRVLFQWNDQVQGSPTASPNFSFYDDIAKSLPRGSDALVVVTGLPSWMKTSSNWIDGNPRKTFVELWFKKIVSRYGSYARIRSYQIWNEENATSDPQNSTMGLSSSPANYVELVSFANNAIRELAPGKLLVSGATTSINQNYPDTLNYNKDMKSAGLEALVDIFAVHYYGVQIEKVLVPDGVGDFLGSVTKPIWITESGAKGTTKQRKYVETVWPFLKSQIPKIARFYYYQFTDATSASGTYGLRNLTKGKTLSDLYIYLRDR